LKFGEISPRQVWWTAQNAKQSTPGEAGSIDKFLSEIGWREFCNHLVAQFPAMPDRAFNPKFEYFPWQTHSTNLVAWQQGNTGYPIVDAGMRELWQTGFMHNRVRMVVASFLTKHLLTHWREGEQWFWDCLLDADLASNACSWQWVGGSGADASPYFRIFNPIAQGEKFDKAGAYTRRWVPELAEMPDKYLYKPWEAPELTLRAAGVKLGTTYPNPIVDHRTARESALEAYATLKNITAA
jgi:deoxyribodipyrimidine photo-lyase